MRKKIENPDTPWYKLYGLLGQGNTLYCIMTRGGIYDQI